MGGTDGGTTENTPVSVGAEVLPLGLSEESAMVVGNCMGGAVKTDSSYWRCLRCGCKGDWRAWGLDQIVFIFGHCEQP